MKTVVFGAAGIVGRAMLREAAGRGWPVSGFDRAAVDVANRTAVREALLAERPELVVNCAAHTRVDACESERDAAFRVNGDGAGNVAEVATDLGAHLVHLSTDYVFDGQGKAPYAIDHPTAPRSVYGASKLAGERLVSRHPSALILRTSWVFGAGGANFVDTMRRLMTSVGQPLSVVDDQVGAPTYAPFLARAVADLGESRTSGISHYQNREPVSWYEFAVEIARQLEVTREIRRASTAEVPRPAPRPAYSVLDVSTFEQAVGRSVELWRDGLAAYLASNEEKA